VTRVRTECLATNTVVLETCGKGGGASGISRIPIVAFYFAPKNTAEPP
jgi:hypothetical protein